MDSTRPPIPDPSAAEVATWLHTTSRDDLHNAGWINMNREFHGIAMAARPFITRYFTTADEQRAAFDGLTLALMALTRFSDIEKLAHLLEGSRGSSPAIPEKFLPPPVS
jgi:hypothetical protein